MSIERKTSVIGKGIAFTELIDKKLKTNFFVVRFVTELTEKNAAANALIPIILTDSCETYPTITDLSRRLAQLYGANVRGGVSKFDDSTVVAISSSCIADRFALDDEDITYETIMLMLDCILKPKLQNGHFYEEDFHLKKQELLDDIDADINDKRGYAIKQACAAIYKGEAEGIAVKGERKAAEALTPAEVYEAYKKLLRTAKIEISYVGAGIDPKHIEAFRNAFASVERDDIFTVKVKPSPVKSEPEVITERMEVAQSKMVMAYKTSCTNVPAMKVFNALFGATPFSLLFDNVREKLSLCYYCSSGYNDKKQVMFIDSGVEAGNIEAAQTEIKKQLADVADGSFSDELIDDTKLAIVNSLKSVNDTPRAVAEWYFSQCAKSESEIITPEDRIGQIGMVTRENIIECAKSFALDTVYVLTGKESAENA